MKGLYLFFLVAIFAILLFACSNNKPTTNHELELCGSEFVFIEGGTFIMGCTDEQSSDCYDDEKPAHEETVADFYIGKYEVTVGEFANFIEATGYQTDAERHDSSLVYVDKSKHFEHGVNWRYNAQGEIYTKEEYNYPVSHVSWNDAKAYCEWLTEKSGQLVRLPSEIEWEYAARGGNLSRGYKYSGSNTISEVAWYDANSKFSTQIVGKKKPNELGIYDMSGNVYEWCSTWYSNFGSAESDINEQIENKYVVVRGGSAFIDEKFSRMSYRFSRTQNTCGAPFGFRVATVVK